MTWFDAPLSTDQRDVIDLVEQVVAKHGYTLSDSADEVAAMRHALVDAGVWTLGVDDKSDGGAPLALRLTALCALGRRWPALAWGVAQTHAAAEVLADQPAWADVLASFLAGDAVVCVLDRASPRVQLTVDAGSASGVLRRLDPVGTVPFVVLLDSHEATLIGPEAMAPGDTLLRAGMPGALTTAAAVDGTVDTVVPGVPTGEILRRMQLAGAAIAAGLSLEAAGRAVDYSRSRVQFGAPLTALPTVRSSLFSQVAQSVDAFARALSVDASYRQAAATLTANCDVAVEVAAEAVQSHGGYGYLTEYEVEAQLRDALSLRAATDAGFFARKSALTFADSACAGADPRTEQH